MLDPIETILEHGLKHSMKKVLTELERYHIMNIPLPDSWAYMHLLQDFRENCARGKIDKQESNMVRKALVNLARQNPTLFKKVEPLDMAALVQSISCLIVVQYNQPGGIMNKKLVDAFVPEWSDQVWKKSCQVYSFKNVKVQEEALRKVYVKQRSLLQDLTGSIAAEKRLRETLSSNLLVQVEKVFPSVLEFLRQIRLSRLEKILSSKETPSSTEEKLLQEKLHNGEASEEVLLLLVKELSIIKRKKLLENHRKLVFEAMGQISNNPSPVGALIVTPAQETEAPMVSHKDRARCIPMSLTLNINGTLQNVPVNRLLPQAENGVCLGPNWFTDGVQLIKSEEGSLCDNMDTESEASAAKAAAEEQVEDEDIDALLQSLEENVNKLEDAGVKNDLYTLIGRVRDKMKKCL